MTFIRNVLLCISLWINFVLWTRNLRSIDKYSMLAKQIQGLKLGGEENHGSPVYFVIIIELPIFFLSHWTNDIICVYSFNGPSILNYYKRFSNKTNNKIKRYRCEYLCTNIFLILTFPSEYFLMDIGKWNRDILFFFILFSTITGRYQYTQD